MPKYFKVIFLLALIGFCGAFIYAKIESVGPDDNYFNTHYRLQLARDPLYREAIGLHYDGDGRSDYLGSRFSAIEIQIDAVDGVTIDKRSLDRFADEVKYITGKPTTYKIVNTNIPYSNLSDEQIDSIATLNFGKPAAGYAGIYVLLADTKRNDSKMIGSTYKEYGIVIFEQSIRGFSGAGDLFSQYVYSTLLHEFGHQLGLPHNNESNCLMNPDADTSNKVVKNPYEVITDFCEFEKKQINEIKLQNP